MEDYGKSIAEIKGEVKQIQNTLAVHDKRIEKHGLEIESIANIDKERAIEMAIVQETLKRIEGNTDEIKKNTLANEAKWQALKDQRDADHLANPKKRFDGFVDKVIFAVAGSFLTFLLVQLFPILK